MSIPTTCAAWDGGAIGDVIEEVLGVRLDPQTTKTVCGRRRRLSRIDNQHPTCPACIAQLAEREAMDRTLEKALAEELRRIRGEAG